MLTALHWKAEAGKATIAMLVINIAYKCIQTSLDSFGCMWSEFGDTVGCTT